MPPPLPRSGVIAFGNDRSDVGIAPYGKTRKRSGFLPKPLRLRVSVYFLCRDGTLPSASPQGNNRPQGDLTWGTRITKPNLPPANRIRSECRTSRARPYGGMGAAAARRPGVRPPYRAETLRFLCRDKPCLSGLRCRGAHRAPAIARRAIRCSRSFIGICLRQIAFVPNAGRARLVPTAGWELRRRGGTERAAKTNGSHQGMPPYGTKKPRFV